MELSVEKAHNETVNYESPFVSVRIFESKRSLDGETPWHYHKELELLVLLDGYMDIHVDEDHYRLKQGDIMLIGAKQLHRDRSYKGLHYIVFQFDLEQYMDNSTLSYYRTISEPGFPLHRLNYIFERKEEARKAVRESVIEIYKEIQNKQEGYEMAVSMMIKKIVLTVVRGDTDKLLNLKDNVERIRLKPVLDYIEARISRKIQVEEASRIANVSYYYFVKYFKKVMGMSFLEYVNYKKIKYAERILLTKDLSVTQVADAIGMPNMAHFYKVFKKYNQCSPHEFRRKRIDWGNGSAR